MSVAFDVELELPLPADTEALGERLAAGLRAGDLVVLAGPLGAGKTVLVRGLARGLGVSGQVTSPTFVIAREHRPLPGGAGVPLRPRRRVPARQRRRGGNGRARRPRPRHRAHRGRRRRRVGRGGGRAARGRPPARAARPPARRRARGRRASSACDRLIAPRTTLVPSDRARAGHGHRDARRHRGRRRAGRRHAAPALGRRGARRPQARRAADAGGPAGLPGGGGRAARPRCRRDRRRARPVHRPAGGDGHRRRPGRRAGHRGARGGLARRHRPAGRRGRAGRQPPRRHRRPPQGGLLGRLRPGGPPAHRPARRGTGRARDPRRGAGRGGRGRRPPACRPVGAAGDRPAVARAGGAGRLRGAATCAPGWCPARWSRCTCAGPTPWSRVPASGCRHDHNRHRRAAPGGRGTLRRAGTDASSPATTRGARGVPGGAAAGPGTSPRARATAWSATAASRSSAARPLAQAEIHTIGVDPAYQRRGIGRELLRGLLAVADAAAATVFLEVRTDNDAAIALYVAEGFATVGLRRRYYRPSGADAYTMRREPRR